MFSKEKIIKEFTVEKCHKCGIEQKRLFKTGDVLFSETVKCNACDGVMFIEKIFGESIEK